MSGPGGDGSAEALVAKAARGLRVGSMPWPQVRRRTKHTAVRRSVHSKVGTVNAALVGYYDSTMFFGSLAPSTQAVRRGILERFRAEHGDKPIAELPPKFITLTLNKLRPSVARNWFKAIRHLMQYAVAADLCPSGIDRVRRKLDVGWSGESHGGCRHEVPPRRYLRPTRAAHAPAPSTTGDSLFGLSDI